MKRHFLFLQGVCSPFFSALADRLRDGGHRISRINFNAGDRLYWRQGKALNFRGQIAELSEFLRSFYAKEGVTDQILFGDRRPVHRPAVELGPGFGIRTHVFEEGYFRPYWITLEREGVNGHSLLPRDPEWFRATGRKLPDFGNGQRFRSSFKLRALYDVLYHEANILNPLLHPHYKTHASVNAAVEYAGYLYRFSRIKFWKRRDAQLIEELARSGEIYYVLPLQLNSDAQIRDHSRFENMVEVMEFVMQSFSRHAPRSARLVIKNHPLDMGLVDYPTAIKRIASACDLSGRVEYLETGDLDKLLRNSQGTVTVNSTVGALALGLDSPTIALSDPIYNLPGLTFQGSLDDFWTAGAYPDQELYRCFRNAVIHTTQVNGGFYSGEGIAKAVVNSAKILEAELSPLEQLL